MKTSQTLSDFSKHPFFAYDIKDILKRIGTDPVKGLTEHTAEEHIASYGRNVFEEKKRWQPIIDFIWSFFNPLILLLIFASIISASFGEVRDFLLIISIIIVSGSVSYYQHFKAEHQAEKLKQKVVLTATVIRQGEKKELPFAHITIGDIVYLSVGDIVPADCRIITATECSIDESVLTGESFPATKTPDTILDKKTELSKRTNMAYRGTHVTSGEATAIVVAIGQMTEFGKIAGEILMKKPETNFDHSINEFGFLLMKSTLLLTIFVFFTNALFKHELIGSFLFALALAVGLTPELLPIILTINLAKGAMKMSKKQVIVKYLPAIQNLGGMNVFCTDKTGTITENSIQLKTAEDLYGKKDDYVMTLGIANSYFHSGFKNPLSLALVPHHAKLEHSLFDKIDDIPYDFDRKRQSVILKEKKTKDIRMITKGAPYTILPILTHYRDGNTIKPITENIKHTIEKRFNTLSSEGFRVVVVATKILHKRLHISSKDETDLTFVGFLTFYDPPKKDVLETFSAIEQMGIAIKILTGDNELVTKKVCEEINIPIQGTLLGHEIDILSHHELVARVKHTTIFARLSPEQKAKIITAMRDAGFTVGYLGDGVNDAPPLKVADVGISVNTGSDIARDVADIILLKKSLRVIKDGVIEGRVTHGNIMKYIMMETSSNFGNMITVAIASLILPFLPMLPVQILLNNFLYDLSQLAIASDHVDVEFIQKPQAWDMSFIKRFMIVFGSISSLFDFVTFGVLFFLFHASSELFHTGWFVESLVTQALIIFSIRTKRIPFFKSKPHHLLVISVVGACLVAIAIAQSTLGSFFSLTHLPFFFYTLLVGIMLIYFALVEITKYVFYKIHK